MAKLKQTSQRRAEKRKAETRPKRADARRKVASLLEAALDVFRVSGVDAPVREIAEKAGVGLGTVYRHFPQRSDLIKAVFESRINACADAADELAGRHEPGEALAQWIERYVDFISTKRGMAAALHSGDPAYRALPGYFNSRLLPAFKGLLETAVKARAVRPGVDAEELLHAVANLCRGPQDKEPSYTRRMVALLVDGLRYGAK